MDVAIIGGGVVGCAAAAFLAEAGATVSLHERERVGAGASGRNSGVVQDPLHPDLSPLHRATLDELRLERAPDGVLVLAEEPSALPPEIRGVRTERLDDARDAEPLVAPGLAALRIETGWAVGPESVTRAFARRAREAGATIVEGSAASAEHERRRSDAVLLAMGAWTPGIAPVWGVTATLALEEAPRHVLEEAGVEAIAGGVTTAIFSLVGRTLGSTFDADEPEVEPTVARIRERARRFVPAAADAPVAAARACPRPQSADGLPLVGAVPEQDGVFVCAGHGPWGISIGAGTARLVADAILGGAKAPRALDPARFHQPEARAPASG